MTRPKGSKNKTKKKIGDGGDSMPEAHKKHDIEKEAEQAIDEILDNPSSLVSATGCKTCGHDENLHYGTRENPGLKWCNRGGCECQAFYK